MMKKRCEPGSDLDLDVDAGRKLQPHQRVDRLGGRVQNIDQTLVDALLELLAGFLVDVRRTVDRVDGPSGRKRDRSRDNRAGLADGTNDLLRRLVDQVMIVRLQLDANYLGCHDLFTLLVIVELGRRRDTRVRFMRMNARVT